MPNILNIETATDVCSIALAKDGEIIFERENRTAFSHAALLGLYVKEAVTFLHDQELKLDAVAVSAGPGSYTGLRIGVSESKGLCYGFNIPLMAINTHLIMASKVSNLRELDQKTLLCPMIDARRMEVYASIFDKSLNSLRETSADIIDENSYSEFLNQHSMLFFGNGADKCRSTLSNENAVFIENIYPQAADMVRLSEQSFAQKQFVDVAYYEPFYLKEFVATVAKNKLM